MLIYEVNIIIKQEVYPKYLTWLKTHIQEILKLPGFSKAMLSIEEPMHKLCVQYYLSSEQDLQTYLKDHAPNMRADGIAKFADKFSASRRILNVEEEFSAR